MLKVRAVASPPNPERCGVAVATLWGLLQRYERSVAAHKGRYMSAAIELVDWLLARCADAMV